MESPADVARHAARYLASLDPGIPAHVEAQLETGLPSAPARYNLALTMQFAALIISAASLAWTIRRDLTSKGKPINDEAVSRRIRIEMDLSNDITSDQQEQIIAAVVKAAGNGISKPA